MRSLALLFLCGISTGARAAPAPASARESTLQKLDRQEKDTGRLLSEMFKLNLSLKKIVKDRRKLEDRKNRVGARVNNLNLSIGEKSASLQTHQKILIETILDRQKRKKETILSVLMSSKSPAQLERQLRTIETIANYQSGIMRDYIHDLELLKIDRTLVVEEKEKLQKAERALQAREEELRLEHEKKSRLLGNLRKSKKVALDQLSYIRKNKPGSLGEEAAAIESLLRGPALYELKGQLPAPLSGLVARRYGLYEEPGFRVSVAHGGIFVGAPPGSPVKAISDGQVVYSREMPGIGRTVVIDHGDHFFSVYGANRSLDVEEGLKVKRGDLIARSGRSEQHGIDGLYFEIRHFSEPQDPLQWVKGVEAP